MNATVVAYLRRLLLCADSKRPQWLENDIIYGDYVLQNVEINLKINKLFNFCIGHMSSGSI